MKKCILRLVCFFVFVAIANSYNSYGQSIEEDTIFVNKKAVITIQFPSALINYRTVPGNAPYTLASMPPSGLIISAKAENTKPALLLIKEGNNVHQLVLAYKKNINLVEEELFFDYSTKAKLEMRMNELATNKINRTDSKADNDSKYDVSEVVDNEELVKYNMIVEEGEKNLKLRRYDLAKLNFERAGELMPGEKLPVQRLVEINTKLNNPLADAERNKKYVLLTSDGIALLNSKKYAESKEAYLKALEMRQGDMYVINQIEKINKILNSRKTIQDETTTTGLPSTSRESEKIVDKNQSSELPVTVEPASVTKQGNPVAAVNVKPVNNVDQREKETRDMEDKYLEVIETANKLYGQRDYSKAKIEYNKALLIFKRSWPMEQLADIDKILNYQAKNEVLEKQQLVKQAEITRQEREVLELENRYNPIIREADQLYESGDYAKAKVVYTYAISILNRPWPNEQITKIELKEAELSKESLNGKQGLGNQDETEKRELEKQELENKYNTVIQSADAHFQAGNYEEAQEEYTRAKSIIKKPWPDEQIAQIKLKIAEQSREAINEKQRLASLAETERKEREKAELESKYNTVIQSADAHFQAGNYKEAEADYTLAKSIIKRPWPDEQISKINKILVENAGAEKAEKMKIEKEAKIAAQFNSVIQKADIEFNKNNYSKARQYFSEAAALKPGEPYPSERLQVIQNAMEMIAATEKDRVDNIAANVEIKRKYGLAISSGKSLYLKADFENAKIAYEEAIALKPTDADSKNQLEKINSRISEIESERALNAQYEAFITMADSLIINKDYEHATVAYNEANKIKPGETYPVKQLRYIRREIVVQAHTDSIWAERRKIVQYNTIVRKADVALTEKRFLDAISGYKEALTIDPSNETVKKGLQIASYQYEKQKEKYDQEQLQIKMSEKQPVKPAKKKAKSDKTTDVQK